MDFASKVLAMQSYLIKASMLQFSVQIVKDIGTNMLFFLDFLSARMMTRQTKRQREELYDVMSSGHYTLFGKYKNSVAFKIYTFEESLSSSFSRYLMPPLPFR